MSELSYTVKKSERKTLSIYVNRVGEIEVLAPSKMDDAEIHGHVEKKQYSIYKYLTEFKELNQSHVDRQYVSGESFMYLGRNYRLKLMAGIENVVFKDNQFLAPKEMKPHDLKELFIIFYKKKAKEKLPKRISTFANQMNLKVEGYRIMELQNRWGSCSDTGWVNFHWKCMMAPYKIIDYIIVHELAHLVHKHHTQAFWGLVDRVLPNYQDSKNWLRINGAGMEV
ncbi:MAG: M48 family metallopeptidase [Bacteroidia bacterium]